VLAWRQGLALPSVPRHYPSRRSSADRTRQMCLLTARDVQAGLNRASCPHSPLRNVPGRRGAHPGSFFLAAALRSSLIRRPGHARRSSHWHWKTVLAPSGAAAGLNSCAAASLEKCSGRVQHLHPGLTLHVPTLRRALRSSPPASRRPQSRRLHWKTVLAHCQGCCGRAQLLRRSLPRGECSSPHTQ
jgi:hypothetical protein